MILRADAERAIEKFNVRTFGSMKAIEKAAQMVGIDEEILYIAGTNTKISTLNTRKTETWPGAVVLTNERMIFTQSVIFNQDGYTSVSLSDILSIDYMANALEGGTINIHTAVKTYSILVNYKKNSIEAIADEITRAKDAYNAKHSAPVAPAAPAASHSNLDEIKKLKELLDLGAITQEEFDAKKKQLLGL